MNEKHMKEIIQFETEIEETEKQNTEKNTKKDHEYKLNRNKEETKMKEEFSVREIRTQKNA